MRLVDLYEQRLKGVNISSIEALEELFHKDDRMLIFALIYFYETNKDLTNYKLVNSSIIRYVIYTICNSDNCKEEIKAYYRKYIDIYEIHDQMSSLMLEIDKFN